MLPVSVMDQSLHFLLHDTEEPVEIDCATLIRVELVDQLLHFLPRWLKTKGAQGHFELLGRDRARATSVEMVKGILDLPLLRLSQILLCLSLLLDARGSTIGCR